VPHCPCNRNVEGVGKYCVTAALGEAGPILDGNDYAEHKVEIERPVFVTLYACCWCSSKRVCLGLPACVCVCLETLVPILLCVV
jgi:hypothetical protein